MEPLRIGLLGASRIAELAITEASHATGDVRAAVAARDPERARAYADEHGYEEVRASYEDLLADDTLDLIYIGLPNGLHAEWTVRALEAGRSVLVEKPFAANLAEFDAAAAHFSSGTTTQRPWAWEAFHYADHPMLQRLTDIVRSGEIGELREVRVAMKMPAPADTDPRWNFDLAGGAMMDLGCYALNILLVLGETIGEDLELIDAEATPYAHDERVDAAVTAKLTLGAVSVAMEISMVSPEWDFGIVLVGSQGSLTVPNFVKPQEDDRLIVRLEGADERVEHAGSESSYIFQLRRIREALRDPAATAHRDLVELARSRRTAQQIDAIYTASGLPLRPGTLA